MAIDFIRGVVRPIVTLGAVAATVAFIAVGKPIPQEWWVIATAIITFWFQTRDNKATG